MKVGYARVSTDKRTQDNSVDAQVRALTKAGCQKVLEERGSGFKGRRKKWEACKDLIRSGKVTHFMICSLSRGSRQGENKEMSRLCKTHGVEFVILDGTASDVTTKEGLLMVSMMDAVNEVDSIIKGEAVKRGVASRKATGATAVGRCPYGYVYDGTKPVPGPEWSNAKRLWRLLRDNEYIAQRVLKQHPEFPFSDPGLRRWMGNPLLMGRPRYSDVPIKPLVQAAEWHRAQEIIAKRCKFGARAPKQIHLFTQSVVCGCCGRWMTTVWGGKSPKHRLKCLNVRCDWYGRGLAEWKVRAQAISALQTAAPQMLAALEQATLTKDHQSTPEQIAVQQKLETLLALQRSGTPALETSISATRLELSSLQRLEGADWNTFAPLIRQKSFLEGIGDAELRPIVSELVKEIRYVGNSTEVEIVLRNP